MENSASKLVLVAHPGDETFAFSRVCAGADVVSVTAGGRQELADEFRRACDLLGGKRALMLNLPDIYPWRLPIEMLVGRLKELGPYSRVYTHSPLEKHCHHQDVAFAASQCFEEIWVRTWGGYAVEAHVLSQAAFAQKLDIINRVYAEAVTLATEDDHLSVAEVTGVEAFVPARFPEVTQARALTSLEIRSDIPNLWAFETSPYEQERYDRTCAVLADAGKECAPASILEIGACEGVMTRRLRTLFPGAKIYAVEVNPVFARRLRESLKTDPDTDIVEASVLDIPLSADLVLLTEILNLVPEHTLDILGRVQAKYLLTSYIGSFDDRVSLCLQRFGWHNIVTVRVLPKFEAVDGRTSFLVARRPGSNIRLWRPA